jgi:glycosyltransferase involved in cell wall biosynthesis
MAAGLPVVVSPVGMNADVLEMGQVGFGPRGRSECVDALDHILRNHSAGLQMGRNGRVVVEQHFSVSRLNSQLCSFLRILWLTASKEIVFPVQLDSSTRPMVTIAMPFYNAEKTIALSIRSLLAQTLTDFELLLCDDGSTDGSAAVVSSFRDRRIVFWSDGHRRKLSSRLNECIARARGEFFARMDADDIAYPERLEKQVDHLRARPGVDLLAAHAIVFGSDGETIGKKSGPVLHEDLVRFPLRGIRMWHPTWIGRLHWFQKHRYREDAPLGQDQELLFRAYRTSRYEVMDQILLGYRQEQLVLKKMVRYRWLWFRHAGATLRGPKGLLWTTLLAALSLTKAATDCVAVWSGLRYRLLRTRARSLSDLERQEWTAVWQRLQQQDVKQSSLSSGPDILLIPRRLNSLNSENAFEP